MTVVVAAVDNSAAARPVLATALALAPVLGATVEAVHVADGEGRTARSSAESFHLALRVLRGDPFTQIVTRVEAADVVAVAMGARGRPTGARPAGHLTLAVADTIDKPLLVVPPHVAPPDRFHDVLIAMEGRPGRERTVKRAVELAAGVGLSLRVVHVDNEESIPSFSDQVAHETEAYAKEFLARYAPDAPDAELLFRIGLPADEILATAGATRADVLVVGWPHGTGPDRGLVARDILEHSHLPVLLVATL